MKQILLQYDVSRGRIPRIETIENQISILQGHGLTGIVFYLESVVQGLGLPTAGCGNTPLTVDMLCRLRDFCKSRNLEFMPIFQILGHQGNLLALKEMTCYAEEAPPHGEFQIDNAELTERLQNYVRALAPCFHSPYLHLGGDEATRIGLGHSAAICRKKGFENALADYLNRWNSFIRSLGKTMVIYGDFLIHYPYLGRLLDSNIAVCNWNYGTLMEKYELENHNFAMHETICAGRENFVSGNCMAEYILPSFSRLKTNTETWMGLAKRSHAERFIISDWGSDDNYNPFVLTVAGSLYILARLKDRFESLESWSECVTEVCWGKPHPGLKDCLKRLFGVQQNTDFFPEKLNFMGPIFPTLLFGDPDSRDVIRLTACLDRTAIGNLLAFSKKLYADILIIQPVEAEYPDFIDELQGVSRRLLMLALRMMLLLEHTWHSGAIWVQEADVADQRKFLCEFETLAEQDIAWYSRRWNEDNLVGCQERVKQLSRQMIQSTARAFHCPDNVLLHYPPQINEGESYV